MLIVSKFSINRNINWQRNGTSWSDGDLVMDTGTMDVNRLGKIVSWNGLDNTDAYEGVFIKQRF